RGDEFESKDRRIILDVDHLVERASQQGIRFAASEGSDDGEEHWLTREESLGQGKATPEYLVEKPEGIGVLQADTRANRISLRGTANPGHVFILYRARHMMKLDFSMNVIIIAQTIEPPSPGALMPSWYIKLDPGGEMILISHMNWLHGGTSDEKDCTCPCP
ncbi:10129_t:CDS:2, partial [Acaulospora colombiana]